MPLFAAIADIAGYLPDNTLSNGELEKLFPGWPAEKIEQKTGIRTRRVAGADQTAGDLAFEAARALFERGTISSGDVDFIILCTQAPDYVLPTTACVLQDRLGIPTTAGALDVNLGCSGFVYSLSLAKGLVETGAAKCVLILTADTYSKYIHPLDKSVRTLFGDGAAATAVIAAESPQAVIGPFVFGTDGSGSKNLIVEAGGFRVPRSQETSVVEADDSGNVRSRENLFMAGAEVMAFSLREVPRAASALLEKAGRTMDDIDYVVLHQANRFMLDALRKKLKVSEDRLPIHIEECGNTVSSTIPLTLEAMRARGCFDSTKQLMLVGFGVGYSWAGCLISFK